MFKKVTKIALAGVIGVGIMVGSSSLVSAKEGGTYESDAKINFKFDDNYEDTTPPVDPEEPGNPATPQDYDEGKSTAGPLSIDYVSEFNFGEIEIKRDRQTIPVNTVPITEGGEVAPYAQVTDKRFSNSGWTLSVEQQEELKNEDEELIGATITINSATTEDTRTLGGKGKGTLEVFDEPLGLVPAGSSVPVLTATDTTNGTFVAAFGSEAETTVELDILEDTRIIQGEYKTTLEWTLSDAE